MTIYLTTCTILIIWIILSFHKFRKSNFEGPRDVKEMWKYASVKWRTMFPENSVHFHNIKTAMRNTLPLIKTLDTMRDVPVSNHYISTHHLSKIFCTNILIAHPTPSRILKNFS